MSKQTAVEWLVNHITEDQIIKAKSMYEWLEIFEQAKQMEKEQIEKSYTLGREQWQKYEWDNSNYENDVEIPTPRKYYNETYGGENE